MPGPPPSQKRAKKGAGGVGALRTGPGRGGPLGGPVLLARGPGPHPCLSGTWPGRPSPGPVTDGTPGLPEAAAPLGCKLGGWV